MRDVVGWEVSGEGERRVKEWVRQRLESSMHPEPQKTSGLSDEEYFSVGELAKRYKMSADSVRHMFENEPGVLKWQSQQSAGRRRKITLRIPLSAIERVEARMRVV